MSRRENSRESERCVDCFESLLDALATHRTRPEIPIWGDISTAGDLGRHITRATVAIEHSRDKESIATIFATIGQVMRNLHRASLGAEGRMMVCDAMNEFATFSANYVGRPVIAQYILDTMNAVDKTDRTDAPPAKGRKTKRRESAASI
jgi:hypothetical protein